LKIGPTIGFTIADRARLEHPLDLNSIILIRFEEAAKKPKFARFLS